MDKLIAELVGSQHADRAFDIEILDDYPDVWPFDEDVLHQPPSITETALRERSLEALGGTLAVT